MREILIEEIIRHARHKKKKNLNRNKGTNEFLLSEVELKMMQDYTEKCF